MIGMMILVGTLNKTGVFQYVAIKAAKGNPVRIAAREGKGFSYAEYLNVGAPVTLLSPATAQVYVYVRY